MAKTKDPNYKNLAFKTAARIALDTVQKNYQEDKYDKENWFPLGASYFGVKNVRGKALEALKEFGFRSSYYGGYKMRMPAGQSAAVGDQMAEDFEEVFLEQLKKYGFENVETFTDSWYN